ncbi:MAG: D-aminoacylase [Armatimonadota bacterium]
MASSYDVLIRGARVVDGTGSPWFWGDVAITGDRIAAVAPRGLIAPESATEVVDATGLVVSPGFIDIQSHSLMPFLTDGRSLSKVTQGVTTEIMGELWSPAPFGGRRVSPFGSIFSAEENTKLEKRWVRFHEWLDFLAERGVSVNFGSFVGGATIREYAKGWDQGDPTPEELDIMRRVMREAMEDGAFGIATALIYPPNAYSPDSELIEVARVVGEMGGVYITHIRSEGDRFLEGLEDAITLGREAKVPVEIYHLKATGGRNWHKMPLAIAMIDQARAERIDITADMYPYVASGTGLTVLLPDWVAEGDRLYDKLRDPEMRARIHDEMINPDPSLPPSDSAYNPSRDHVMPVGLKQPENRKYIGQRLPEIAAQRGQDWADAAIDLLASENQRISTIFFSMNEDNLRLQLQQPWIKISTDAGGIDPEGQENPTHPRAYGTYTRVLAKYVREEKVLTLEDAVRKMSGAVAQRLNMTDRGLLLPGQFADIILFDPETVTDHATFSDPHHLSTGIQEVWVNGGRVVRDGKHTGAMPGRPVYGPGRKEL